MADTNGRYHRQPRACGRPYCSPKETYRFEFELSNGTYVAEVFEYTDPQHAWDVLGLPIRRKDIVLSSDQR
jgi:hypothetical protein